MAVDEFKHAGDSPVFGVIARDRGNPVPEVHLLDASAGREDSRAGIREPYGHAAPHPTARARHECHPVSKIGHKLFTSVCAARAKPATSVRSDIRGPGRRYGRIVTFLIVGGVIGRLMAPSDPMVVGVLASASTTSMPVVTLPKIT